MGTGPLVISPSLILAARSGDSLAIRELWDRCTPILEDAIHQHTGLAYAVEPADAAQEAALTFLQVLRTPAIEPIAGGADPASTDFAATLARTLYWRIRSYVGAERRRQAHQIGANLEAMEHALARTATGARPGGPPGHQLTRAIARLSPRQRAVIAGLYFDGRDIPTISNGLGVTPQAVTALHRRALANLREQLSPEPTKVDSEERNNE